VEHFWGYTIFYTFTNLSYSTGRGQGVEGDEGNIFGLFLQIHMQFKGGAGVGIRFRLGGGICK